METVNETWSGDREWKISGGYFRLLSTVNPVDVVLTAPNNEPRKASQVEGGFFIVGDFVNIKITTAANEQVKFVASESESGTNALVVSAPRSVKFTASGSYVVPAGVQMIKATLMSGGAGGGGGFNGAGGGGGGGGGAGLGIIVLIPVTSGETLTVTVGAGGAGGAKGVIGGDSTASSILRGGQNLVSASVATGGGPGTATNGGGGGQFGGASSWIALGGATGVGAGAAGVNVVKVDSGASVLMGGGSGGAGGGPSNIGGSGGSAFGYAAGNLGSLAGSNVGTDGGGGGAGTSALSRGGNGGSGAGAGNAGVGPGAGGGGGGGNAAGGAGQSGLVIIEAV